MTIAIDPVFLGGILTRAIDEGFVKAPREFREESGSTVFICINDRPACFTCIGSVNCCNGLGGGGGDSKDAGMVVLVIAVIAAALASIVTVVFAAMSARTSRQCQEDANAVEDYLVGRIKELPATDFMPYVSQAGGYGMNSPAPPVPEIYKDAIILLKGQRNERILAAISLGTAGIGLGLLTVSALIALLAEGQIPYLPYLIAGGTVVGTGVLIWGIKYIAITNNREQLAANRIASAITA